MAVVERFYLRILLPIILVVFTLILIFYTAMEASEREDMEDARTGKCEQSLQDVQNRKEKAEYELNELISQGDEYNKELQICMSSSATTESSEER